MKRAEQAVKRADLVQSTGVALLKQRVDSSSMDINLEQAVQAGKERLQGFIDAGAGVASFTLEAAIWLGGVGKGVGKGMGSAADLIRSIRTSGKS